MGKPQLGYWNIRGLAQSIRLLLAYLEVDYEEVIYADQPGDDTWDKAKYNLKLAVPNLPYWIDENEKLSESKAILKYLVRKYKPALLPTDISILVKVEQIEGLLQDIDRFFAMSVYMDTESANAMFESKVPEKLRYISKFLEENTFFLGDGTRDICYLDFLAYETLYRLKTYRPKMLEGLQNLSGYVGNFERIPTIAAYIKSPGYIKAPCYMKAAKKQI